MAAVQVLYSPAPTMDISRLNKQTLTHMKYHQLIKLSKKYNVTKQWAKKDELIQSLLNLKQQVLQNDSKVMDEESEWTDGQQMFNDKLHLPPEKKTVTSRGTFTIDGLNDSKGTFIVDNIKDSRGTFSITNTNSKMLPPQSKGDFDRRLTFDIPKKKIEPTKQDKVVPNVKKLTVPYSRPVSRNSTVRQSTMKESPLKLSSKSITIKKTKNIMSPMKSSRMFLVEKKPSALPLTRPSLPKTRPAAPSDKPVTRLSGGPSNEKENISIVQPVVNRRKSKSDNPEVRRKSTTFATETREFRTPPASGLRRTVTQSKISNSKVGNISGLKPFTAGKVPDFAKMHQRNFDKMDSLDEYIHKKADRVKKLFGTPQVTKPLVEKVLTKTEVEVPRQAQDVPRPMVNKLHINDARKIMSRNHMIRTQTDVKDKNRSHIHGIRSNKRFELQMRFRNMS